MVHSLEWLRSEEIEFYECSGNICADIGLEDADGLLARAQIGVAVGSPATMPCRCSREMFVFAGSVMFAVFAGSVQYRSNKENIPPKRVGTAACPCPCSPSRTVFAGSGGQGQALSLRVSSYLRVGQDPRPLPCFTYFGGQRPWDVCANRKSVMGGRGRGFPVDE
jgi:hypothetical protein